MYSKKGTVSMQRNLQVFIRQKFIIIAQLRPYIQQLYPDELHQLGRKIIRYFVKVSEIE